MLTIGTALEIADNHLFAERDSFLIYDGFDNLI